VETNEIEEYQCNVCGEEATKYYKSYAICDNPVCFQVRLDYIAEVIKNYNNKAEGINFEDDFI
jgi:hypothetical protein